MKVMIAYPSLDTRLKPMLTQNRQFQWYHVGSNIYPLVPAFAAALLNREGYEVIWHDGIAENVSLEDMLQIVSSMRPDLLAMETKTPVVKRHWRIIKLVKQASPETSIALMGDHVTAFPEESFENSETDYVITGGDFDAALLSLARHISGGSSLGPGIYYRDGDTIGNTGPFVPFEDLDSLPFPDRTLTKAEIYGEKWRKREPFFYTLAGRDCPWHRCTFCSWTTLYPKFRVRSPDNLLQEIGELISRYGAKEIFDDTGTFPRGKWLEKFCQGMKSEGFDQEILFGCNYRFDWLTPENAVMMKRAGFRKIKVGLESANTVTLERLRKGITPEQIRSGCRNAARAGLDVHLTVMFGYPWENRNQAEQTFELVKDLMKHGWVEMLQATILVPYPGTPLYEQAVRNEWLSVEPDDWESFDMSRPVLKPGPGCNPAGINELVTRTYKLHFNPWYLLSRVIKLRRPEDLRYALRGIKAMLGHVLDFFSGIQGGA
ncbi:MAG: radical SAM protein [Deltaproteobacteria bacterium]|nr:radical SAM protein [Deltaproteobacteria bacterium]